MDLGDRTEDSTIDFMFSTRNVSAAPAALASGAISVYKANGTTQSTAGITLTASFGSVTGLNHVRIVTTDAFYATANDYIVVITTGTVNSVSVVGTTIATFSIENRFMRGTDSALLSADINLTAGAVDNVTTVATTTTNTDMRGTDSALLAASINLTGGAVDNVTTVATTTTNTDMRGTDSALLASSAPTNWSSLVITVGGAVDSLVQGFINSTLTESSVARINDNFEFFYDNANAQTTQVVDDVGGGGGGGTDWTASERNEIRGRLGVTGTTAAGGNTPTLTLQTTSDAILVDTGTTIPNQISGLNDVAATDIVSAGAITTLSGAVVNVDLVDTLTTYTGNTPQTADHTAGIADIPTVSEFNARTIPSANYFDPAADTVATVTTVTDGAKATALATVDTNVDAILVDTSTTIPAQITALNDITADDVLAAGDADGFSLEESLKLLLSASTGILSGAATSTIIIKAADGSKTRLTATVDVDGNRSAVVKDVTG